MKWTLQFGIISVLISSLIFSSPFFVPVPSTQDFRNYSALIHPAFADLFKDGSGSQVQETIDYDNNYPSYESTSLAGVPRIAVTDFVALPNDGLDDTVGFRKAVVAASNSSGLVFIPAGIYNVNNTISLDSGIVFEGEGKEKSIIKWSIKNTTLDVLSAKGGPESPVKDITLRNFWINGTGSNTMGNCIKLVNTINFRIEDTKLTNCGGDPNGGAIYTRTSANGIIIHNVIDGSRNGYITPAYYQITPTGSLDFFDWNYHSVDNQTAESRPGGSNNILIAYNLITNSVDDALHPQNGFDNKIIGNIAIDSGDDNIDTFREKNTAIENNTIIMNKQSVIVNGFEIGDGSEDIMLKNNKVVGGAAFGINVATDPRFLELKSADSGLNRNITIIGNEVTDSTLGCLRTFYSEYVLIANNTFHRCNTISIFQDEPSFEAIPNETSSQASDVGAVEVEQELLRSQGGYSVLLATNSHNITITNNLLEYIGGKKTSSGVYLRNPDFVQISNNRIQVAPLDSLWDGDGIYIAQDVDNVGIDHNDLSACGCVIEIASGKQNIRIGVLETSTTVQTVRVPFDFAISDRIPSSSGTAKYSISGESVIRVKSVEANNLDHKVLLELDRGPDKVNLAGSIDIVIPKQIMNTVTSVTAFSNMTADVSDNSISTATAVQQGALVFVEHQTQQKPPFQRLSSDSNSTTIRVMVSEIVDSLEIVGSGSSSTDNLSFFDRLASLDVRQTGMVVSIITIIAGLGSAILYFEKRSNAPG